MKNIRHTVSTEIQQSTADALQSTLVELIDLSLQTKQAHWAVFGESFKAVHEFMDELTDFLREQSDDVGERILALGAMPNGAVTTIQASTPVPAFPHGAITCGEAAREIADRVLVVVQRIRERIEQLENEPVSQDLLIALTAGLEKYLWMLNAQEG